MPTSWSRRPGIKGRYVRKTLESVPAQTVRPVRWVVVSDASTDDTDAVAREFAQRFDFIDFARREDRTARDFSSQVYAQRFGCERLKSVEYDFVGMLDADISLEPDYYERILRKFHENAKLGIAGGFVHEEQRGVFRSRKMNSVHSVAGGIQLFRRECFEAIGGYMALKWGGMDTVAEIMARMRGWEVRAFPGVKGVSSQAWRILAKWNPPPQPLRGPNGLLPGNCPRDRNPQVPSPGTGQAIPGWFGGAPHGLPQQRTWSRAMRCSSGGG